MRIAAKVSPALAGLKCLKLWSRFVPLIYTQLAAPNPVLAGLTLGILVVPVKVNRNF